LLRQRTDGVPASSRSDAARLAADLRTLGIERVLFGSDHPVFDAREYAALLRDWLPLSDAELRLLMTNEAPLFDPRAAFRRIATKPSPRGLRTPRSGVLFTVPGGCGGGEGAPVAARTSRSASRLTTPGRRRSP